MYAVCARFNRLTQKYEKLIFEFESDKLLCVLKGLEEIFKKILLEYNLTKSEEFFLTNNPELVLKVDVDTLEARKIDEYFEFVKKVKIKIRVIFAPLETVRIYKVEKESQYAQEIDLDVSVLYEISFKGVILKIFKTEMGYFITAEGKFYKIEETDKVVIYSSLKKLSKEELKQSIFKILGCEK